MTIAIEDGSSVDGANSYIIESEFNTYISDRGYTVTSDIEPLLIRSFDYLSTLTLIDPTVISDKLKQAQSEIAYRLSTGLDPAQAPENGVKRKKVDVLETEFFSSTSGQTGSKFLDYMPHAKALLKGLVVMDENRLYKA